MPVKDNREYRSFQLRDMKLTKEEDGACIVEGYATTFDEPYDFCCGIKECIRHEALDDADMSDVIFQYNHEGMVLARQKNGTMELVCDEHGLHVKADISGVEQGRNLFEAIQNGLVDSMSWGFMVDKDGWEYDSENEISYITKISKVYDVSAVSIPANADTEISARSYFQGVMEMKGKAEEVGRCDDGEQERQRMALRLRLAR
jgi:uncharacterized protein